MSMNDTLHRILTLSTVVPVVVLDRREDAVPLANALLDGGVRTIEITLRTEAALGAIEDVAKQVPDITVGAGTIASPQQMADAMQAGAAFIVSPGLTRGLAQAARDQKAIYLPGVTTTTEVMQAREEGFTYLKFFPAALSGGIAALRHFGSLFQDVRFCPTGGISRDNAADYLALPNVLCVGGSWLAPKEALKDKNWNEIRRLASDAILATQLAA